MNHVLAALGYFMLVGGHVLVAAGVILWLMRRRRDEKEANDGKP